MKFVPLTAFGLAAALLLSPTVEAQDDASAWLMRISEAARTLNYDGTFFYQQGAELEAVRIVHQVRQGRARERLVSLNGAAREVIRDDQFIKCYLPDEKSILVEHRKTVEKSFPTLLPEKLQDLDQNYIIDLGRTGRVAGREAQVIAIKPRDNFRYGYRLWADRDSGLLLRAELTDRRGEVLERFMFTWVAIGRDIPDAALKPQILNENMVWHRDTKESGVAKSTGQWRVSRAPKGFALSNDIVRIMPTRGRAVQHLVYSDGLAAVSIFIEKVEPHTAPAIEGASRMGAVHAFGRMLDGHHITVVGEVPAGTVALFGSAVTLAK